MADLLILVAAAGVASFILRLHLREPGSSGPQPNQSVAGYFFWTAIIRSLPFIAAAVVAPLVLRARRPRPSWRLAFRQPGTVACLASTLAGGLSVAASARSLAPYWFRNPRMGLIGNPLTFCLSSLERVGGAVLIAWMTLALAGAWRPAPNWIDRCGRVLGASLIVLYFLSISGFLRP